MTSRLHAQESWQVMRNNNLIVVGFHLLGVQGGNLPPQTLNLPPQSNSPSSVCTSFLATINPKVVQITCQYKVPTK